LHLILSVIIANNDDDDDDDNPDDDDVTLLYTVCLKNAPPYCDDNFTTS